MIILAQTDPRDPQAVALLKQSHALMRELFAPEENSFLEVEELCQPHIKFYSARKAGVVLGVAALAIQPAYGEVKSMFVGPSARRQGVGDALMRQLEDTARDEGLPLIKLETGVGLDAAQRLYFRCGFTLCGPFADYVENGASIFMEKSLDEAPRPASMPA